MWRDVKRAPLAGLAAPESGFALAVKSDALWVRTGSDAVAGMAASKAGVSRLRMALEGSRSFGFEGGQSLTLTGEAGLRRDAGDAEAGILRSVVAARNPTPGHPGEPGRGRLRRIAPFSNPSDTA